MAGRPRKNIDKEQFEKLCFLHCTLEEIAGFFVPCLPKVYGCAETAEKSASGWGLKRL